MDRKDLLSRLRQNSFEGFHFGGNTCHLSLRDDCEVMLQLTDGAVPRKRAELLASVLENYDSCLENAARCLESFGIDIGRDPFPYGVYVGEYSYGAHGPRLIDGFTISLKREDGTAEDPLNAAVYTALFHRDGRAIGAGLWLE